eukprot:m51a1_g10638 hypothetical protein (114) ;mRNA; r:81328-81719
MKNDNAACNGPTAQGTEETKGGDSAGDDGSDSDDDESDGYITASITRYGQLGVLDTWLERLRAMPTVPGVPESAMDKDDAEMGTAALAGEAAPAPPTPQATSEPEMIVSRNQN